MEDGSARCRVGMDIGGTRARAIRFGGDWRADTSAERQVRDRSSPDGIAGLVGDMLDELAGPGECEDGTSVGIGLAAQLDVERRVVRNSPNLGWRDVPFADLVEEEVGRDVDVRLENDLSAQLWGEFCAGAASDVDDALAIYVGTGVGGAMIAGGELIVGNEGFAGEIGHSKVEPGGRLCGCGERGCVEAYAGGVHLERRAEERARETGQGELVEEGGEASAQVDLGRVDERARRGEQAFDALWDAATDDLAVVSANACTLLDPAVLLLGGGVVENCGEFRRRLTAKIPPVTLEVVREHLEIRSPDLGRVAGPLGAAKLAVGNS